MPLRRTGSDAARSEVGKAEAALDTARREWAETEETLAQAIGRRDALVDDAGGYGANEQQIRELRSELGRRHRLILRREQEVEETTAGLCRAEYDEARGELERACTTNGKHSGAVAETLETLSRQLSALEKSRAKVAELEAKVKALAPERVVDAFEGLDRDEPSWPETAEQLEVVAQGPRRPLARATGALEEVTAAIERGAAERIAYAVRMVMERGEFDRIERLEPRLLPRALRVAERFRDNELERRSTEREDLAVILPGRQAPFEEALDRRLEKVRELAEQVEAAA